MSGLTAKQQRRLAREVKRARHLAPATFHADDLSLFGFLLLNLVSEKRLRTFCYFSIHYLNLLDLLFGFNTYHEWGVNQSNFSSWCDNVVTPSERSYRGTIQVCEKRSSLSKNLCITSGIFISALGYWAISLPHIPFRWNRFLDHKQILGVRFVLSVLATRTLYLTSFLAYSDRFSQ